MRVLDLKSTTIPISLSPIIKKMFGELLTVQCSLMLAFKVFDIVSKNADSGESANNLK